MTRGMQSVVEAGRRLLIEEMKTKLEKGIRMLQDAPADGNKLASKYASRWLLFWRKRKSKEGGQQDSTAARLEGRVVTGLDTLKQALYSASQALDHAEKKMLRPVKRTLALLASNGLPTTNLQRTEEKREEQLGKLSVEEKEKEEDARLLDFTIDAITSRAHRTLEETCLRKLGEYRSRLQEAAAAKEAAEKEKGAAGNPNESVADGGRMAAADMPGSQVAVIAVQALREALSALLELPEVLTTISAAKTEEVTVGLRAFEAALEDSLLPRAVAGDNAGGKRVGNEELLEEANRWGLKREDQAILLDQLKTLITSGDALKQDPKDGSGLSNKLEEEMTKFIKTGQKLVQQAIDSVKSDLKIELAEEFKALKGEVRSASQGEARSASAPFDWEKLAVHVGAVQD